MAPNWALLEQYLAEAEGHVRIGSRHVARQRETVDELARGGHDTVPSRRLLDLFEELQAGHVAHRDRVLREVDARATEARHGLPRSAQDAIATSWMLIRKINGEHHG